MSRDNKNHNSLTIWGMSLLLALGGCGHTPLVKNPKDVAWYQRVENSPAPVTIVDVSEPELKLQIEWLGKGGSTGDGINEKMENWRCGDWGEAQAAAWIGLVCMVAAVPVGAIDGASKGLPKDALDKEIAELRDDLSLDDFGARISERALAYATELNVAVNSGYDSATSNRLEFNVERITVRGSALPELAFNVSIDGEVRLLRDGQVVHKFKLDHFSGHELTYEQWQADDGMFIDRYVEQAIATLARDAVDEALLVWYANTEFERPWTPAFTLYGNTSRYSTNMSWEQFPRKWDFDNVAESAITDVTYRVQIYELLRETTSRAPDAMTLVAEQRGLMETSTQPNIDIDPCKDYVWTVRAEFLLNGQPRVSEWSGNYDVPGYQIRPWRDRRGKYQPNYYVSGSNRPAHRYHILPTTCFARFQQ